MLITYVRHICYRISFWSWKYMSGTYVVESRFEVVNICQAHMLSNLFLKLKIYVRHICYRILFWSWKYMLGTYVIESWVEVENICQAHMLSNLGLKLKVYVRHICYRILFWSWKYMSGTYVIETRFEAENICQAHMLSNLFLKLKIYVRHICYRVLVWSWKYMSGTYVVESQFEVENICQAHMLCIISQTFSKTNCFDQTLDFLETFIDFYFLSILCAPAHFFILNNSHYEFCKKWIISYGYAKSISICESNSTSCPHFYSEWAVVKWWNNNQQSDEKNTFVKNSDFTAHGNSQEVAFRFLLWRCPIYLLPTETPAY